MIRKLIGLLKPKYVYRSAVTGKFVSEAFAKANPGSTIRERV
jgi:hypothetical protein